MFGKLKSIIFGSDDTTTTAPRVRVVSSTEHDALDAEATAGPPVAGDVLDEITALQARMSAIRAQIEATNCALASAAQAETALIQARAQLEMECYDAWLHPQLAGLHVPAGRTAAEVWAAHDAGIGLSELSAVEVAAAQQQRAAPATVPGSGDESEPNLEWSDPASKTPTPPPETADASPPPALPQSEAEQKDQPTDTVTANSVPVAAAPAPEPHTQLVSAAPLTEEEREKVISAVELLTAQREAVGPKFGPISATLKEKREKLEDRVFALEMRLLEFQGEERELRARQRELLHIPADDEDNDEGDAKGVNGSDVAAASEEAPPVVSSPVPVEPEAHPV